MAGWHAHFSAQNLRNRAIATTLVRPNCSATKCPTFPALRIGVVRLWRNGRYWFTMGAWVGRTMSPWSTAPKGGRLYAAVADFR